MIAQTQKREALLTAVHRAYKLLPFVIVAALAGCGQKVPVAGEASASAAVTPAVTAPATSAMATVAAAAQPVIVAKGLAPSAADLAKGEKIYTGTCGACHGEGNFGAPIFGDKAEWQPRIAKGMDALYNSSINGFRLMPRRGGNAALKDDEMKAAVDYMTNKAS